MTHNFDEVIERRNTNCMKWDAMDTKFGGNELVPLWVADMDFQAPKEVIRSLQNKVEHGIFGYPKPTNSLKQVIQKWMEKRHHWMVEKEWITYTSGVVPALGTAINAYTDVGDHILIQTPVYYPFFHMIKKNDRELVLNELVNHGDRYTIDFDDLEEKFKQYDVKMFILCSPHNPVGRVWKQEELEKLGEICLKYNVVIVSDEIHSDLTLYGNKHIPMASLSEALLNQTITCVAPSKTFNLAGLQAAAIIIPNKDLLKAFQTQMEKQGLFMVNAFGLTAMEAAYEHGEEWLDHLLGYLEGNINYLLEYFEEHLPQLTAYKPEGTYLVWVDCRKLNKNKRDLELFMSKEAKVALNQGYIFGEDGNGFVRINVACPRSTLEEGLNRLKNAVNRIDNQ